MTGLLLFFALEQELGWLVAISSNPTWSTTELGPIESSGGTTMHGFYNRVLKVDLSEKRYSIGAVGDEILKKYLGGKGLVSYLLYELDPSGVDPLDPANCLIFATGPVTGSTIWEPSRYGVFTKSPRPVFIRNHTPAARFPRPLIHPDLTQLSSGDKVLILSSLPLIQKVWIFIRQRTSGEWIPLRQKM